MKKSLLILNLLLIFLVSCSPKVSYTEEFPYLPSYKDMVAEANEESEPIEQSDETEQNTEDDSAQEAELKKVTYFVDDADIETALSEYEEILHQNGWTTTLDNKPNLLEVKKDDHVAIIIAYKKKNTPDTIVFDISSK